MSKAKNTQSPASDIKRYDFTGKRKIFYIISSALVILSILVTFLGVDIAIEFRGGTMITYSFTGDVNSNEIQAKVKEITNSTVNVQQGDLFQSDKKKLSISFVSNEGFTAEKQSELTAALQELYADNELEILDSTDVAASSGRNFFVKCIVAVAFSSVILILYIAFRFKRISGWSSGICAVIALIHDVIVTYGFFVIIGFQINSNFIAVVLTILGCSINNTIVVYDRIRENKKLMPVADFDDLGNFLGRFGKHDHVRRVVSEGNFRRFGSVSRQNVFLTSDIALADNRNKFLINLIGYSHGQTSSPSRSASSTHRSTQFGPSSPSSASRQNGQAETMVSAPVAAASRRRSAAVHSASSGSVWAEGAPQQNAHSLKRTISLSVTPGMASRIFLGAS